MDGYPRNPTTIAATPRANSPAPASLSFSKGSRGAPGWANKIAAPAYIEPGMRHGWPVFSQAVPARSGWPAGKARVSPAGGGANGISLVAPAGFGAEPKMSLA